MSQMHHRNPGAVGAVLIHPKCHVKLFPMAFTYPDLLKFVARDKPIDKIVLVTDALTQQSNLVLPCTQTVKKLLFQEDVFIE